MSLWLDRAARSIAQRAASRRQLPSRPSHWPSEHYGPSAAPSNDRFDALARTVAVTTTRRTLLKTMATVGAAYLLGRPVLGRAEARLHGPQARPAQGCQDSNSFSTPCDHTFWDYLHECGTICPDHTRLPGKAGCTIPYGKGKVSPVDPKHIRIYPTGPPFCAEVTVHGHFSVNPRSKIIHWTPSETPCCPAACRRETQRMEKAVAHHEAEHRKEVKKLVAKANQLWTARLIKTPMCVASDPEQARLNLAVQIDKEFEAEVAALDKKFTTEPPQPGSFDCNKCAPAQTGYSCCKGVCADLSTDSSNCGTCGSACLPGEICCNSACQPPGNTVPCAAKWVCCDPSWGFCCGGNACAYIGNDCCKGSSGYFQCSAGCCCGDTCCC